MAAVSGARSDVANKPPSYPSQTMPTSRSSTSSRDQNARESNLNRGRLSIKDIAPSSGRFMSPARNTGVTENGNLTKMPPESSRPLPNGPGPLNARGEKTAAKEVLHSGRTSWTTRQSRKDGIVGPVKAVGPISVPQGQSEFEKTSSNNLSVTGKRPPRSSSSVNISASTRNVTSDERSGAAGYLRPSDDSKLSQRNLNLSNDKLDVMGSAPDRGIRSRTRDMNNSSAKKSVAETRNANLVNPQNTLPSIGRAGHPSIASDSSINGSEESETSIVRQNSKSERTGPDDKLRRNSRENEDSVSSITMKTQMLDMRNPAESNRGLSGLHNLGNTCFMNSILQCLSNTRSLLEFCLSGSYSSQINTQTSSMKGTMIKAFVRLMEEMWKSCSSVYSMGAVSPTDFKYYISKYSRHFVGTREHDAHEFLVYLLEGLQEDLNRVREKKKRFIDSSDQVETISATEKARLSWERYIECDNSTINDIFMGQLRSALTCKKCGYISNTFEPFLSISLPIKQAGSQVFLYDCFKLFTHEETLDGDNKPKCAKCRTRNACTKQMSIQKFPKVLIIHLMRFKQGTSSKLNTQVSCPVKGLELSQFTTASNCPSAVYNLYAVSNHSGTPLTGHYTAFAKHPYSNQWHVFNDSRVTSISLTSVHSSEAYLLFYELQDSGVSL